MDPSTTTLESSLLHRGGSLVSSSVPSSPSSPSPEASWDPNTTTTTTFHHHPSLSSAFDSAAYHEAVVSTSSSTHDDDDAIRDHSSDSTRMSTRSEDPVVNDDEPSSPIPRKDRPEPNGTHSSAEHLVSPSPSEASSPHPPTPSSYFHPSNTVQHHASFPGHHSYVSLFPTTSASAAGMEGFAPSWMMNGLSVMDPYRQHIPSYQVTGGGQFYSSSSSSSVSTAPTLDSPPQDAIRPSSSSLVATLPPERGDNGGGVDLDSDSAAGGGDAAAHFQTPPSTPLLYPPPSSSHGSDLAHSFMQQQQQQQQHSSADTLLLANSGGMVGLPPHLQSYFFLPHHPSLLVQSTTATSSSSTPSNVSTALPGSQEMPHHPSLFLNNDGSIRLASAQTSSSSSSRFAPYPTSSFGGHPSLPPFNPRMQSALAGGAFNFYGMPPTPILQQPSSGGGSTALTPYSRGGESTPSSSSLGKRRAFASRSVGGDGEAVEKKYKCPKSYCTKVYKNSNGLKYHVLKGLCEIDPVMMDQVPPEVLNRGPSGPKPARDSPEGVASRPYWCRALGCGKRYKNLNGLKYHGSVVHPELDFILQVKGAPLPVNGVATGGGKSGDPSPSSLGSHEMMMLMMMRGGADATPCASIAPPPPPSLS